MLALRVSAEVTGAEVDLRAVTGDGAARNSGVRAGQELVAFAEAAVRRRGAELASARHAVRDAIGSAGLVDAAAVIGNFERMVRIADSTGIPTDAPVTALIEDVRGDLGIDRYRSAANTPASSSAGRALGRIVRPLLRAGLRTAGAWRRARS